MHEVVRLAVFYFNSESVYSCYMPVCFWESSCINYAVFFSIPLNGLATENSRLWENSKNRRYHQIWTFLLEIIIDLDSSNLKHYKENLLARSNIASPSILIVVATLPKNPLIVQPERSVFCFEPIEFVRVSNTTLHLLSR